ncbi:MAG: 3'-5' exonuclease [Prevotellaceae bacterium]|nr:3'-5' exonuclease [Prevotellaceae bacterium]
MRLNLKNPIVFFDVETTGLDIAKDRIVEISILKILPDHSEECKTRRINPTIPIPKAVQALHGITDADVVDCPTFPEVAKSLAAYMEGCDIAGYNALKFDIPILAEEFIRAGVRFDFRKHKLIDVQAIFYKMEPRTLSGAYRFYCNKVLENAHSAEADTRATYEVLQAQLDKYDTLQNDMAHLSALSNDKRQLDYAGRFVLDDNGDAVITFGKHKGKRVTEVLKEEPTYYTWIMTSDFTLDTKRALTELKLQQFGK